MKSIQLFLTLCAFLFSTAFAQGQRTGNLKMVRGTANPAVAEVSTVDAIADVGGALGGKYFTIYSAGDLVKYVVWLDVDDGSTAPVVANSTLVEVNISSGDADTVVASAVQAAVDALADFSATVLSAQVTITNAGKGAATNIAANTSGFTVGVSTQGVSSSALISSANIGANIISWKVCNDAVQTSTYLFVGTGLDATTNGVSLGKDKCFVCVDCSGKLLQSLKVSSQAASDGYTVIQYRQ